MPITASVLTATLDDLVRVEEVATAEYYVGDLFRRQFGSAPPDYPRHFVAWYRAAVNAYVAIGFLHCTVIDDLCLFGGLVEDERAIGRMPVAHQMALRGAGGVAARLFSGVFAHLSGKPAFWAHVGDERIRSLFVAAGFEATAAPFVLVRWNASLAAQARDAMVARVAALGAF
ncbi:MAG: hypothetical protein IT518_04885 [Burkholderiales bacterium]|nr:hypothetical protein [Burkholderiales bacterium]